MRFPQFAGEILTRLKPCLRLVDMVWAGRSTAGASPRPD